MNFEGKSNPLSVTTRLRLYLALHAFLPLEKSLVCEYILKLFGANVADLIITLLHIFKFDSNKSVRHLCTTRGAVTCTYIFVLFWTNRSVSQGKKRGTVCTLRQSE